MAKIFVCSYLYNDHLIVGLYHIDLVKAFSGCLTIDVFVIARLCGWFALLQHAAGNTMVSKHSSLLLDAYAEEV